MPLHLVKHVYISGCWYIDICWYYKARNNSFCEGGWTEFFPARMSIWPTVHWATFRASIHLSDESFGDVNSMAKHFTSAILTAAKASIPQSSGTTHHVIPQFHGGIRTAQFPSEPRNEHWPLKCHPTKENLINYEELRSRAWWVIRDSKKSSWRAYISSLTHHTSSRDVQQKVKKNKMNVVPLYYLWFAYSHWNGARCYCQRISSHSASLSSF